MIPEVRIQQVAARTIEVRFERRIDPSVHDQVLRCSAALSAASLEGIDSVFITYHSVGVHLSEKAPASVLTRLTQWVDEWSDQSERSDLKAGSLKPVLHHIPVRFGGEDGPDLAELAAFAQISESEVVRMFCEPEYRVYMTGFIGGFPYLGVVPPVIRMPRRNQPRKRVAPGSVAIAAYQAGIYPVETPGGWNLIGRTVVDIPSLQLQPGESVRFVEAHRD
jgi:KipI family sensor histidine kinase inhibitor